MLNSLMGLDDGVDDDRREKIAESRVWLKLNESVRTCTCVRYAIIHE